MIYNILNTVKTFQKNWFAASREAIHIQIATEIFVLYNKIMNFFIVGCFIFPTIGILVFL